MTKKTIFSILLLLIVTSLLLAACGGGTPEATEAPVSQEDQINLIYTQAAETLQAEIALTEAAKPLPTSTPLSSPTPVFIATNTPIAPAESPTPFPTLPSLPSPTPQPTKQSAVAGRPLLRAELMFESPQDGIVMKPGQSFVKQWNFANAGETTWNENFGLIHVGEMNFSDLGSYNLVDVSNMTSDGIPNGGKLIIKLSMQAPSTPGHYRSVWLLRDDNGKSFGIGALGDEVFWVDIIVRE
ncbi:MAG: NBR1-Ig-like domain-containing protein [Anaerolineales bacterium]